MTENVKRFIEDNIEIIEQENWFELFDLWYNTNNNKNHKDDNLMLFELFDVLSVIGINQDDHEDTRTKILLKYIEELIQSHKYKRISTIDTITRLRSYLGFDYFVLKELFKDVCNKKGFKPDRTEGVFTIPS